MQYLWSNLIYENGDSNDDKYHSVNSFLVKICKLVKQNAAL